MTRRFSIVAIALTAVLAWVFTEPPLEDGARPRPPATPTPEPAAKPPSMALAEITLPPPPTAKPAAITPLQARMPASTSQATEPAQRDIEPLAPAPKPPASKPPAKIERKPEPSVAPTPPPRETTAEGRPLLRLLEFGKGPSVEIAWPGAAAARRHLFRVFRRCYGMRVALMAPDGRLFDAASRPGHPWTVNLDRYSGFVRRSAGGAASEEDRTARRIRSRHGLRDGVTVRLFPRRTDALLLGGLKRLIGDGYGEGARITARYRVSGWRVGIEDIAVDAKAVPGQVDLSGGAVGRCAI